MTQALPSAVRAALPALRKDQYVYVIEYLPLAGGANNAEASFTVEAEADFDLEQLSYFAEIGGATQTESTRVIPVATVQILGVDTRRFASKPMPIPAFFGIGMVPFVLKQPKRLVRKTVISTQVTNRVAATAYNLWLLFIGSKIYRPE